MVIAPGLIRNQQVAGSNPAGGSSEIKHFFGFTTSSTFRLCPIPCPPLGNFHGVVAILESRDRCFFRFLPDVTVVLHHFAAYMADESTNGLLAVVWILDGFANRLT
jgi:hypothetical protein